MNERQPIPKTPGDYGLITAADLAKQWEVTPARARQILSAHGIKAVIGYDRDAALASHLRPGQGRRTDLDRKERAMTSTTSYGTWSTVTGEPDSPAASVAAWLGDAVADFDTAKLTEAYIDAITAALPDGVHLSGANFYGPSTEEGRPAVDVDVAAVVESVDFYELAKEFAATAEDEKTPATGTMLADQGPE